MGPIARLGVAARKGFARITPDPFVLAIGLTLLVFVAAVLNLEGPVGDRVVTMGSAWGDTGLWGLLGFAMQATLILTLGTAVAEAPAVRRGIEALAGLAKGPRGLVALTAFVSVALGLLNWSLSLIGSALFAREVGRLALQRGEKLHYPLVCAAAYSGLMVWHGGLSGTAPLKVTQEKDVLEVLGPELAAEVGTMPLPETLFSPLNLVVALGLLVLAPALYFLLTPRAGEDTEATPAPAGLDDVAEPDSEGEGTTTLERLERSVWVNAALAGLATLALVLWAIGGGFSRLDLDHVNLILLAAGLVLHGRPDAFGKACARGLSRCLGIVIQFPLYAGIMAMMKVSGLSAALAGLASGASAAGLSLLTFFSAGLLNLFVPSGGGQWAVQGQVIMQAAVDAQVDPSRVLMAMAYGDQWTNMLQPFWALPLLAVTGVKAREIVGYTAIWMVAGGALMAAALVLMP